MTRILVVEDDEGDAALIDETLRDHGDWTLTRARTVLEAIRTAGDTPFDAAIVDYDLPDGTGLDLLNFLRIGSPGIRIVLLSKDGNETLAMHALSHGAGDYLVKDSHLGHELPRRMETLLHEGPATLVETLHPGEATYDEPPAPRQGGMEPENGLLGEALDDLVGGPVFAAAAYDRHGHPIATRLIPQLDPSALGFALASLHHQVGAFWTLAALKPTGYQALVEVEGGILAITAVPRNVVVALILDESAPPGTCLKALAQAARKVRHTLERMQGRDEA